MILNDRINYKELLVNLVKTVDTNGIVEKI